MKHFRDGLVCQVCGIDAPDHTESQTKACGKQLRDELKLGQYSLYTVNALFVKKTVKEKGSGGES